MTDYELICSLSDEQLIYLINRLERMMYSSSTDTLLSLFIDRLNKEREERNCEGENSSCPPQ